MLVKALLVCVCVLFDVFGFSFYLLFCLCGLIPKYHKYLCVALITRMLQSLSMHTSPFLAISVGSICLISSLVLIPTCLALLTQNQTTPPLASPRSSTLNASNSNHTHTAILPSHSNSTPPSIEPGPYVSTSTLFPPTVSTSTIFPPTVSAPSKFNPAIGIIIVVMLGAFFSMGILSLYIHRCTSHYQLHHRDINSGLSLHSAVRQHLQSADNGCPPLGLLVSSLPTMKFTKAKAVEESMAAKAERIVVECVVCLSEFEEGEELRFLPKCGHCFHLDCIDMWLFSHTTCPLCRRSLLCEGKNNQAENRDVDEPLSAVHPFVLV